MNFTYDQPLTYTIDKQISVLKVKHGVTEASLSDGRMLRLSLHIDAVALGAENKLDILYQVITEVITEPSVPIMDIHEAVQ